MSKVKITGHASGSGTITLTGPNTSSDRTITLPDATGTALMTDGSAASLTSIPAANITGTLPAIDGSNLTGLSSFDVTSITGATALAEQPAQTDELVISDAGTLKRVDISHMSNTPCFQAYHTSEQNSLSDNVWTKVGFDSENFSIGGTYDDTTNYRWTPGVAGKYYIAFHIMARSSTTSTHKETHTVIYKNSTAVDESEHWHDERANYGLGANSTAHCIIDMDSNDYVEAYIKLNTQASTWEMLSGRSAFWGYRIIGT